MLQAQRYRHRIEIQERIDSTDSETGDLTHTWDTLHLDSDTPLNSVPAQVLLGPGREFEAAHGKQGEIAARINCRWFPGLLLSHRVLWDGMAFDLDSIETDQTGRAEYRLKLKTGVTDGA